MRGRRGTFGTSIDVSGSLATKGDIFDAAAFCVAGVTHSAPQARFAWQAWYFRHLHRCQRKLGDEGDIFDAAAFDVAGVTLSAPQARFAWQAWHFEHFRLALRGRRGAFSTSIDVSGSLATKGDIFDAAAFCVAGVTLSAPQA